MSDSVFHIIYPSNDHARLALVEFTLGMNHVLEGETRGSGTRRTLQEYALASRKQFTGFSEAESYASALATSNGKQFAKTGPDYLD